MAAIYEKTSSDKALIIGPRESLTYPFDFGDWSQIRIGLEVFCFASSGFGFSGQPELIPLQDGIINPTTCFFWGLKETGRNLENNLPFTSGNNFIGYFAGTKFTPADLPVTHFSTKTSFYSPLLDTIKISAWDEPGFRRIVTMMALNDSGSNSYANSGTEFQASINEEAALCFSMQNSGAQGQVNYINRNSLLISIKNKNALGQSVFMENSNSQTGVTPSMDGLRSFLANPPN